MSQQRFLATVKRSAFWGLVMFTGALHGCGGGGTGIEAATSSQSNSPSDLNTFMLYPNSVKLDDGTQELNSTAYATAYYQAIDSNNDRDTLAKFKAKNGFGNGTGTEISIIIGDQRDLGYGRKMTGRQNPDGTIAFVVENYLVGGYGPYSTLNVEAAIRGETKWHIGTNGIEFSPIAAGESGVGKPNTSTNGTKFIKFYTYDPVTGARLLAANLDGRGNKAMPTVCISCHGGRGDPLTPSGLFPRHMNSESLARGDVAAQAHPFEPASFDFSSLSGYTRTSLEANIKELNKLVLCTMPRPSSETAGTFDGCRRTANSNEYQGTAAAHIKHMYGGNNLPNATAETTDTYSPGDWASAGQSTLYDTTVAQACRVCHSLRGTGNQSDIDFESFTKFDGYADRVKAHIVDRGNMPLVKLIFDKYWNTSAMQTPVVTFLTGKGYSDANKRPGRPIADPGPDRVIKSSSTVLSGAMSLYSSSYQWTVTVGAATLSNSNTKTPTFTATGGDGTYTVQLITGNGTSSSVAATQTIVVDSTLGWDPQQVSFNNGTAANQIRDIFQSGGGGCTSCHTSGGGNPVPPVFFNDAFDRSGTGVLATNRAWLYKEVRGRINFDDIVASAILRKPSGNHHNGGLRTGFDSSQTVGNAGRQDYDKLVAWILRGAPEN